MPSRRSEPDEVRSWITDVNDGIITVAGMGFGLAGAEVAASTTYAVVGINAVIGALSVFGAKFGERFADREAEQDLIAKESSKIALTPAQEEAELVAWFQEKGVSDATARMVAAELNSGDAVSAQLLIEYGIKERTTVRGAWGDSAQSGLGFLIGALLPLLAAIFSPWTWHAWFTIGAAAVSLVTTSFVLARRGHSDTTATILRSLVLGAGTMAVSYFLGDMLL